MSSNEKPGEGAAELSGNTYYPPPPPGPPPSQQGPPEQQQQQQQHLQQPLAQQYQPHPQQQPDQQQYFPPPPGPADEKQSHVQQQQQQPYFPPPPPAPHAVDETQSHHHQQPQQQHQQQHQQPSFPPPPPASADDKQSHHQQQSAYAIPAYNPANPAFAPPPTAQHDAQTPTGHPGPASSYAHQQPPQPQHQQPPPQQSSQTAPKKSGWGDRFKHFVSAGAAAPINSLAHKLGSQSFLPETLDKECDKSAAILRSFCTKGVYADPGAGQPPTSTDPKAHESSSGVIDPTKEKPKNRVIVTIPPKVISKAVGLAIFTTLRAGFQVSGATGSGVLIARLPDGSWSPPSGIQVHSVGGGFQIGLDIYDCVCVINSREALAAFMNTRVSLGSDLAVVAGPYGAGGAVDFGTAVQRGRDDKDSKATAASDAQPAAADAQPSSALKPDAGAASKDSKRRSLSTSAFKPVFSYVKSRGFYAGIQVDGTVVVERKDANASFYGAPVTVQQILQGQVPPQGPRDMWPVGARALLETLRGAEAGALGHHSSASASASGAAGHPGSGAVPLANAPPAGAAPGEASSGAPPAYVDDGSHAHVGDVKYA
ncbi:hypothetical protein H634G_09780 [Metarhizium anisopliae BRIP 53293]|uniref:Ysc84 actin-binding domain-containing protein n=1 Tax=Metarhizium anisopliae BRIP 53293 TaxID=1291518 RepID=A0A0D9NM15_METAN|nr:hypothetical protein H634G_09780 [Metarhizium anisopliae BRIP 53293]KJK85145.1 hypothetical protein H633G_11022 [Metarhizium anisopliae BRIP 53284]